MGVSRGRASGGYPIGPGCPLGLRLCLIRMLCHPKSPAAHPDQACNQLDIDTSRQTPGLENSGTVPELVWETSAMHWAVDGGIERRFHPKEGFRNQFRRRFSRLGAHRMR